MYPRTQSSKSYKHKQESICLISRPCEGTYFLTAGITKLTNEKDFAFCERLIRDAGVALIPLSAFFSSGTPDTYVRFAFCKQQALIEQSLERLEKYFKSR